MTWREFFRGMLICAALFTVIYLPSLLVGPS